MQPRTYEVSFKRRGTGNAVKLFARATTRGNALKAALRHMRKDPWGRLCLRAGWRTTSARLLRIRGRIVR